MVKYFFIKFILPIKIFPLVFRRRQSPACSGFGCLRPDFFTVYSILKQAEDFSSACIDCQKTIFLSKIKEQRGSARGQGPPRVSIIRHRQALKIKTCLAQQHFAMGKMLGGRSAVKKACKDFLTS
ncbi:MAG: hypothetical protein V8T45_02270 [Oscillospiraceae bacterium]